MNHYVGVVENNPERILSSLHPRDTAVAPLLHHILDIVADGDNLSSGIRVANYEMITYRGPYRPEIKGNHIFCLLVEHSLGYNLHLFVGYFAFDFNFNIICLFHQKIITLACKYTQIFDMSVTFSIKWFETIDSTNSALAREKAGLSDRSIYAAYFQTAGRGQRGNTWESRRGENLTFSILFKPESIKSSAQFIISEIVTLGIVRYLKSEGVAAKIKWPNDIYVGDKKLCGILIENTVSGEMLSASIAGIGININQKVFESGAPNPTSLSLLTGKSYEVEQELIKLAAAIMECYTAVPDDIEKQYLDLLYRRGEWHDYIDCTDGSTFSGRILGITETACLSIEKADGTIRSFAFKELKYII